MPLYNIFEIFSKNLNNELDKTIIVLVNQIKILSLTIDNKLMFKIHVTSSL